MTTQFVLTCGSCQTSHLLTGDEAVVAAEIATFVAAHHEHGGFRVQSEAAGNDAEPAD